MEERRKEILLAIIKTAFLNIRCLGEAGRAVECAVEADHVHNIPELLATEDEAKYQYYWDIERLEYLRRLSQAEPGCRASFEPLWEELERIRNNNDLYTIYIPLITSKSLPPCLSRATGVKLDSCRYRVLRSCSRDPEDGEWLFPPGSIVECETRTDAWPPMLVAKRRVG